MSFCLLTNAQDEENWISMMLSQQQREGILFQASLKSQDDFCIKYDVFKDDDCNGESHQNIDRVTYKY